MPANFATRPARLQVANEPFVYDGHKLYVRTQCGKFISRMDCRELYHYLKSGTSPTGNADQDAAFYAAQLVLFGLPEDPNSSSAKDSLLKVFRTKDGAPILHIPTTVNDMERRLKRQHAGLCLLHKNTRCLSDASVSLLDAKDNLANNKIIQKQIEARIRALEAQDRAREVLVTSDEEDAPNYASKARSESEVGTTSTSVRTPSLTPEKRTSATRPSNGPSKASSCKKMVSKSKSPEEKFSSPATSYAMSAIAQRMERISVTKTSATPVAARGPRASTDTTNVSASSAPHSRASAFWASGTPVESVSHRSASVESIPPPEEHDLEVHPWNGKKYSRDEAFGMKLTMPAGEDGLVSSSVTFNFPSLVGSAKYRYSEINSEGLTVHVFLWKRHGYTGSSNVPSHRRLDIIVDSDCQISGFFHGHVSQTGESLSFTCMTPRVKLRKFNNCGPRKPLFSRFQSIKLEDSYTN